MLKRIILLLVLLSFPGISTANNQILDCYATINILNFSPVFFSDIFAPLAKNNFRVENILCNNNNCNYYIQKGDSFTITSSYFITQDNSSNKKIEEFISFLDKNYKGRIEVPTFQGGYSIKLSYDASYIFLGCKKTDLYTSFDD
jgi:hypothetical protein